MNAYELADRLFKANFKESANMIIQQADRIAKLEKQLDNCTPTVDDNSQDWKGMDGATAFWLIERHSNNWTDAKKMMNEWFEANSTPQIKELSDEEIIKLKDEYTKVPSKPWSGIPMAHFDVCGFAKAILKKASEK